MKARIVLAGLLVSMMVVEVSAQHAEYDDMYFRGKDREKNKAIDAEEAYASAKTKKQMPEEVVAEEVDNVNPTDSYSARNVNPEYVSRSNSEKASEDEANYYLEGYTPPAVSSTGNLNNSYYNNANQANSSYYPNNSWNSPYYASCGCNPYMGSPYGYGSSSGWNTGLSVSLTYGNYWSPYGGYGMYSPYYGGYSNPYYGGGYGYPNYYGSNNYYNESPRVVNYGKRPSRNSATITPSTRPSRDNVSTNTSTPGNTKVASTGRPTRVRQVQDEYYVRPARRTSNSLFSTPTQNSGGTDNGFLQHQNTQPTRTRETYSPPTRTPSYTPSSTPSPSRGNSGGSGGGGGSSPRRGRG